jgi:hypothetical protein
MNPKDKEDILAKAKALNPNIKVFQVPSSEYYNAGEMNSKVSS